MMCSYQQPLQMADSLDILVVLTGGVMHVTFMRLFSSSRFLCAAPWTSLDPITEARPSLVCTVGFDKPLRLARAVMVRPYMIQEDGRMKHAGNVILEALYYVGNVILRDYALEIAVLIRWRQQPCRRIYAVAAVAMDCLLTFTLYTAVLTIMVEVRDCIFVTPAPRLRLHHYLTHPLAPPGVLCFVLSSSP